MNRSSLHIVFSGGETPGYLMPGLAVAEALHAERPTVRITFAGNAGAWERRRIAAAGYDCLPLCSRPSPRRLRDVVPSFTDNLAGHLSARRFLDDYPATAVVGLGDVSSLPMARAALARRVPLILLEQNVVPGLATRRLARSADSVCVGLAPVRAKLRCRCSVPVTGTPIFCSRRDPGSERSRRLVVLGGSGNNTMLNQTLPRSLYKMRRLLHGWQIVHQAGAAELQATRALYQKLGLPAVVADSFTNQPDMLAGSDLAVCGAGGTVLAELSAAGVPAVLVPSFQAESKFQRANAALFAKAGGVLLFDPPPNAERPDEELAKLLASVLTDPARVATMATVMRRFARPRAAADVADLILERIAELAEPSVSPPRKVGRKRASAVSSLCSTF